MVVSFLRANVLSAFRLAEAHRTRDKIDEI